MADQEISASEKKKEDWMNSKWRPMMGWMYMVVCSFDFVLAPILWSLTQSIFHGAVNVQWQPLTLQGAGLFHISMGAVLGIAAYGRTQEKLNGANNGGISLPSNVGTTYTPPAPIQPQGGPQGGFGSSGGTAPTTSGAFGSGGFGSSAVTNSIGSQPLGGGVGSGFGSAPSTATPDFGGGFGSTQPIATTANGKKIVPDDPNAFPLQ